MAAAAAAGVVAPKSHGAGEVESKSIAPHIPRWLLERTHEYTASSIDFTSSSSVIRQAQERMWMHRHRDMPAIFRATLSLTEFWSIPQRQLLAIYWKSGWQNDVESPLHALVGNLRSSHMHHHYEYAPSSEVRSRSVAVDSKLLFLSDSAFDSSLLSSPPVLLLVDLLVD